MSEELTAEARLRAQNGNVLERKLLRLYYAERARTEAAEQKTESLREECDLYSVELITLRSRVTELRRALSVREAEGATLRAEAADLCTQITANADTFERLSDGYLARAVAAERLATEHEQRWLSAEREGKAAESRLAEATALLPRFKTLTLMRSRDAGEVYDASSVDDIADELATALSATPAQAAEPEREREQELMTEPVKRFEHNGDDLIEDTDGTYVYACDYDAALARAEAAEAWAKHAQAAELDQEQQSLRISRVNESELTAALESARAERDTALAGEQAAENRIKWFQNTLQQADAARDTALARIAELEADRVRSIVDRGKLEDDLIVLRMERDNAEADADAKKARIARAVAELEQMQADRKAIDLHSLGLIQSLESARAERDTALGEREACEKHLSIVIESRDTALARIAELELATQPDLLPPEDQPVEGPKLHTRACICRDCLRACIARAVAELETATSALLALRESMVAALGSSDFRLDSASRSVARALEALR